MHAGQKPYSFAVCRDDRGVDLHVVSLLFVLSYLVESVWGALVGVKFVARFLTLPELTK